MKISTMWRHIKEGMKNLLRNGWMTFASLTTVGLTLLILGTTLIMTFNAQQMSGYVTNQLDISVFLKTSVTDQQGQQLAGTVAKMPGIKSVQYVSKEAAMKSLSAKMGQYKQVLNGMKDNPLPVTLVVRATDPRQTVSVAQEISSLPQVDNVFDAKGTIGRLFQFLDAIRDVGLVFVIALIITAMFLISNTIRITILNRRREIEIMKLVGATNWFVRWPFVVEAILIGVIGTAIPYGILMYVYHLAYQRAGGLFFGLGFTLSPVSFVATRLAGVMFGLGIIIGLYGGMMSIRKSLRT